MTFEEFLAKIQQMYGVKAAINSFCKEGDDTLHAEQTINCDEDSDCRQPTLSFSAAKKNGWRIVAEMTVYAYDRKYIADLRPLSEHDDIHGD